MFVDGTDESVNIIYIVSPVVKTPSAYNSVKTALNITLSHMCIESKNLVLASINFK